MYIFNGRAARVSCLTLTTGDSHSKHSPWMLGYYVTTIGSVLYLIASDVELKLIDLIPMSIRLLHARLKSSSLRGNEGTTAFPDRESR